MRWDLIASGMMLTVLLAAVVSVSGVLTYFYKHRHKQRQRRCASCFAIENSSCHDELIQCSACLLLLSHAL